MNDVFQRPALAFALCLPLVVLAQQAGAAPTDGSAPSPQLQYHSAFADYKPWQDVKPTDWRSLNDSVRGGAMAGHGPGSMAPAAAPASAPSPAASAPAMPGHSGHPMHGGKP